MDVPAVTKLRRGVAREVVLSCPATHRERGRATHPDSPLGGAWAILPPVEMQFAGTKLAWAREFQPSPAWPSGVGVCVSLSCPHSACLDPVVGRPYFLQEML